MKIAHVACLLNPSLGVLQQMQWEREIVKSEGLDFETYLFTRTSFSKFSVCKTYKLPKNNLLAYVLLRVRFFIWILKNRKNYDLYIFRYSMHDPFMYLISLFIKNYATLHHSFEVEEIELYNDQNFFIKKAKLLIEKYLGVKVINKAKAIIGVTEEICKYELLRIFDTKVFKPFFVYPNGIYGTKLIADRRASQIECILVSSNFQPWVGLDLLIDQYNRYGDLNIKIHLVGNAPKELLSKLAGKNMFVYHGVLEGEKLLKLYERAWLGITSFGFHRKQMKQACTLKAREYLSLGIPVVGGHEEVGLPQGFKFYRKIKCSLHEIKRFAIDSRIFSRKEIRETSLKYIDKRVYVEQFINFLSLLEMK